jgi:NodT family efflux transporter outer membrane factor (OMF) lipoprotein
MKNFMISSKGALAGILVSAALAGCAVGPDYQAPKTELAPFHNQTGTNASAASTPALDEWWVGFNDPELVRIVQQALAQNLDLAASMARVNQARAVASGSSAQLLPTVDLDGSVTREHQSVLSPFGSIANTVPGYKRNTTDYAVGPAASWEIDLFGGLRRGAAAAKDEEQAAEADGAGTRISVAADAADAYFQIRGYQSRLAIAQQQIDDDEHLLQLVQDQLNAGVASVREISEAQALLKQAQASVPPLRIGLEVQLNRLDVLMGVQPGTYATTLQPVTEIASMPAIPGDEQPVDVLRRRPDVIAAERRLAASNERIGAAISDYYPKISLSGALGLDSISAANMFTGRAFQGVGSGALVWRIFDFGKINAEVAQAHGANAEALAEYRQSVLRAAEDVEDSLTVLAQTKIHVDELQGEVEALQKARDLSEQSYKAGSIALTDVLDADRQLLSARDEWVANRVDTARSAVGVFRAFGGGWDVPPAPNSVAVSSEH